MSRNFELLTQIDCELDGSDHPARPAANAAVVKEAAPHLNCGEEILRLVQSIFLSTIVSAPRKVVFCSADGENGSSPVCASAGRTLAASGSRSVCLVDGNVRSQCLSSIFRLDTKTSFSNKSGSVREQCIQISGSLWLAGAEMLVDDRGALVSVDGVRHLLGQLCGVFDYVLIDAPGTSVCGDAAVLGQAADAAVLVIEANRTRRLSARKAKEVLDAAGVRLLGTVLQSRSFPIPERLYKRL